VNYLGDDEISEPFAAAYDPHWAMQESKAKHHPTNFIRINQNKRRAEVGLPPISTVQFTLSRGAALGLAPRRRPAPLPRADRDLEIGLDGLSRRRLRDIAPGRRLARSD
jgi:hypothetical protein